jgi:hypothetical protein
VQRCAAASAGRYPEIVVAMSTALWCNFLGAIGSRPTLLGASPLKGVAAFGLVCAALREPLISKWHVEIASTSRALSSWARSAALKSGLLHASDLAPGKAR